MSDEKKDSEGPARFIEPEAPGLGDGDVESRDTSGSLPPPAFPPGARSRQTRRTVLSGSTDDEGEVPPGAFISPDDPMPGSELDDAFIDPDAPIVRTAPPTKPDDYEAVLGADHARAMDLGEVVVTGMGDDAHLRAEMGVGEVPQDPFVADLLAKLDRLANAIRSRGEAGLRATPEMTRFEVTLRGYCVGYLAGLREEPDF